MNWTLRISLASAALALIGCGEDLAVPVDTSGTDQSVVASDQPVSVSGSDFVEEAQLFVHACEPNGIGQGVPGDQIANFTYQNCLGEDVSLHDYCGRRDALWVVGSAGWCGACIAHFPEVVSTTQQRRRDGLETFIFVGETDTYSAVTQEYCMGFANAHGIDPAMMIFENGTADGLQSLWSFIRPNAGGGGSIGLPWEAVLDPYDMTFFWDSSGEDRNPLTPINTLLGD